MSLLRQVLFPFASRLTSGTSHLCNKHLLLRNLTTSANGDCIQQNYGKIQGLGRCYHLQRTFSTSATEGDSEDGPKSNVVVKLRGIPWSSTKTDIQKFLNDCKIYNGLNGIHLVNNPDGRPAGEAFVEIHSDADIDAFLQKDKKYLGHRYVEISTVARAEMEWNIRKSVNYRNSTPIRGENCLLMKGLPFKADETDIRSFFDPIIPSEIDMIYDLSGRPSGTAKVTFGNDDDFVKAMGKHRQHMGHRYIELISHNN